MKPLNATRSLHLIDLAQMLASVPGRRSLAASGLPSSALGKLATQCESLRLNLSVPTTCEANLQPVLPDHRSCPTQHRIFAEKRPHSARRRAAYRNRLVAPFLITEVWGYKRRQLPLQDALDRNKRLRLADSSIVRQVLQTFARQTLQPYST
jgi:hypothetical protein